MCAVNIRNIYDPFKLHSCWEDIVECVYRTLWCVHMPSEVRLGNKVTVVICIKYYTMTYRIPSTCTYMYMYVHVHVKTYLHSFTCIYMYVCVCCMYIVHVLWRHCIGGRWRQWPSGGVRRVLVNYGRAEASIALCTHSHTSQ